jgi:hypothetical protein
MRRVGLETITLHKIRRPAQLRVSPVHPLQRAPQLHHLAQWLRHRRLALQAAVGAVAVILAEAHLRALHQRPPRLHRTLQLLPLAAVVAGVRIEVILNLHISENKKRLLVGAVFIFYEDLLAMRIS